MSLKESVARAKASRTSESTSGKNPAHYAKLKQCFIDGACASPIAEVRIYAAGSEFTPVSNLKKMLSTETEKDVLSVLLQNTHLPLKSIEDFLDTDRAKMFNEDDDAFQFVVDRMKSSDDSDDSNDDDDAE